MTSGFVSLNPSGNCGNARKQRPLPDEISRTLSAWCDASSNTWNWNDAVGDSGHLQDGNQLLGVNKKGEAGVRNQTCLGVRLFAWLD